MNIKLMVIGAAGRMGSRILQLAVESGQFNIVAAIENRGHPDIGKDAGFSTHSGPVKIILTDTFSAAEVDVVVDFSLPDTVEKNIDYCLENKIALVLGITGLTEKGEAGFKEDSHSVCDKYECGNECVICSGREGRLNAWSRV